MHTEGMSILNTKIFIVSHKNLKLPKLQGYQPLQVGLSEQNFSGYIRDNTGKNIASRNPNYCELTAMYWIWKNVHANVKGLVHYRRFFSSKSINFTQAQKINHIISLKDINSILNHYDMIIPKKRHYYIETMWSHYNNSHKIISLELTRKIIKNDYPSYLHAFDITMNSRSAHMFNMMIAKSKAFDAYSTWLFDILFKLEDQLNISNWSKSEARVYGYVSELLLDVWLKKHKEMKYKELPVSFMGNEHWIKKISKFLLRKIK